MPRLSSPAVSRVLLLTLLAFISCFCGLTSHAAIIRSPVSGSVPSNDAAHVPLNITTRYAVRWMDPTQGLFGATLNLTFADPALFSTRWQIRFRLADNGTTAVKEYWGSWTCTELTRGWYQIIPREDLRLSNASQAFFSFNGVWNSSNGDWNTTKMASTALEVQISPSSAASLSAITNNTPTVFQLRDAGEFANEPVPFEIPAAPFGNFVRGASRPGVPVARMLGSLPPVPTPMPTTNFLGLYIVTPFLAIATLAWIIAAIQSWRWRKMYRIRAEQVALKQQAIGGKPSSSPGTPQGGKAAAADADFSNAYAGYYMLMDGAWDQQVIHDGDEDPIDAYGRPYSIAPVVTDTAAFYHPAGKETGTPGRRRRTTLLIPGKEYRMTLLERGIPMPNEWLPMGMQKPAYYSPEQQNRMSTSAPPATTASIYIPAPPPVPEIQLPMMYERPSIPPPPTPSTRADSPAVQSRGIAGISVRRNFISPTYHVAETVPAVEGAVHVDGPARDTMIPISEYHLGVVPTQADQTMSPLSPGWPLVEDEGSAYSLSPADSNGDMLAVSLSSSASASRGINKPLPVKGWNMI